MWILNFLKDKYYMFQVKNFCLSKYRSGELYTLGAALDMLYNQNPKYFSDTIDYILDRR